MLCVAVPVIVTPPVVPVAKPLLIKLPFKVNNTVPNPNCAEEFTVSGAVALNVFATVIVILPIFAITTPPDAVNGVIHSSVVPTLLAVPVLYSSVAFAPYVTVPVDTFTVAVPCIDRTPFTVGELAKVLVPEPESIKLLYVNTAAVCPPAL